MAARAVLMTQLLNSSHSLENRGQTAGYVFNKIFIDQLWSNRWCISNSLIYQCMWYILWYIGKTADLNTEQMKRNNLMRICYKKASIIHTTRAGLRQRYKIKTIKRFLCTNCANQRLLQMNYKANIQTKHTKDFH